MQAQKLFKAGLVAGILVIAFVVGWETWWRNQGFIPTYNDDKTLWSLKRAEAYRSPEEATVFIGSSRIKFDLDIPTWRSTTGEDAIQLSLVGTSPLLLLEDLANDQEFRGKLVVDITEPLFFSANPFFQKSAVESVSYYHKQTPSEKLSTRLNLALESKFAFLEERRFSLNTLLNELELPNRPGVFAFPAFPKTFEWSTLDRQTYMSDLFLSDTNAINRQTEIWKLLIMGDKTPPLADTSLQQIFRQVAASVEKIRARGGKVIFTRTPSSGFMGEGEKMFFPRAKYWEPLLTFSKAEGIHFLDYPETRDLVCPEWSHLSMDQAKYYTSHLAGVLRQKGWFENRMAKL